MKLKPLFARVLLERPRADKVGSIILTKASAERHASLQCKILATGPECDPTIRPGMVVLIGNHAGKWLDEEGTPVPDSEGKLYIAQDEDLLCEVSE